MDNSALKNEFLIESFENLSSINEDLTKLEKTPDDSEILNKVYRTVHTMKGSASFLGYKNLQDITHCAENLLDALRENEFSINAETIDALFETFDISHKILKGLETSDDEPDVDINTNKARLESLLESKGSEEKVVETELAPATDSEPVAENIDDELSSLITGHREGDEAPKQAAPSEDSGEPELSAAALDSLRELVGEGKVDAHLVDELSSSQPAATTEVEVSSEAETSEDIGLSAAALDSLKELVGDGKVDSNILAELTGASAESVDNTSEGIEAKLDEVVEQMEAPLKVDAVTEKIQKEIKAEEIKNPAPKPKAPAAKPTEIAENRKSIADSFVRVNVNVLDNIMNIVGELVLSRNQIVQYSNVCDNHELTKLSQQLNMITSELQAEVMSTRMQPIGSILAKFERLVRDLARQNDKKINLKLSGQDTELDKTLIEAIKDPLVHILRNSCDHGLETVEEREANGKDTEGTVWIKSYNESGQVTIEIVDDGRGLNRQKIGAKAIEKEIITEEKLEQMTDAEVYNLIFAPGFSTAEKITNISGRGVGMDVVKTNIEKIGGAVHLSSVEGQGTTFKLRIPLTLAIVPALIIKSKGESFALPQLNLVELVRLETQEELAQIENIQGSEFLKLRGSLTPVFRLDDELNLDEVHSRNLLLNSAVEGNSVQEESVTEKKQALNVVILNADENFFGIIVDEILDTQEIVVKPLGADLKRLNLFGGATIMGDGTVALILDALGFLTNVADISKTKTERSIKNDNENEEYQVGYEVQENLLFKLSDSRTYAVPLALVSRLEEVQVSAIEKTGNQPIVRYLDKPMPLLNLEKTLGLAHPSKLASYNDGSVDFMNCIVILVGGKNYGLIVEEVLDISIDSVRIDDTAVDRDGVLGTVFINDQTISILDLYAIIDAQNIGRKKFTVQKQEKNFGKRILVVEDSSMYRNMEAATLRDMGFIVDTAVHGQEGFELIKTTPYDLIVTDVEMPFMNGFELAEKIRGELNKPDLKIMALTTRFSDADKAKGKEVGFNYHLEKFKKDEVVSLVQNIFDKE